MTVLRKERRLPIKGDVIVSKGDRVSSDTIVARTHLPGNVQLVNVASKLGLPPEDLPSVMIKEAGDPIEKGKPIAMTKGFFGLFKATVNSPCDGTLDSISTITGQVILREPPMPIEVDAYVDGEVVEVFDDEGVAIEVKGSFIQGIFGVGGERAGEIHVAVEGPDQKLEASLIDESMKGKVVIGGSHIDWEGLQKAMKIGVNGIVVGGFDDPDLKRLLGKDLGVAITGSENIATTLILTEGFGAMGMAGGTFNLLKSREGKKASINGARRVEFRRARDRKQHPHHPGTSLRKPRHCYGTPERSPEDGVGVDGSCSHGEARRRVRDRAAACERRDDRRVVGFRTPVLVELDTR
jgi:hypothetical protein